MYHVDHVEITGFWGKFSASTSFDRNVNVLIGKNGTGKTTFMDMLQAVLRVDLGALDMLDFEKITIRLKDTNSQRTVSVRKERLDDRPYDLAIFKIGRTTHKIPLHARDIERMRHINYSLRIAENHFDIKQEIDALVNVASLSVHRISYDDPFVDDDPFTSTRMRKHSDKPIIDRRIEQLSQALTAYQLNLAEQEKEVSDEFQRAVLASVLFDEEFDRFDISIAAEIELGEEQRQLLHAYTELGADSSEVRRKIENHFEVLNDSLSDLRDTFGEGSTKPGEMARALKLESILPLPLLRRTQHIIKLSLEAEKRKQEISRPITLFIEIASTFMDDKQLRIEPSSGKLHVRKDGETIPLLNLSSGEKQLLILLIETLLQQNQPFIFLADEPEISLHIEWQEKVIETIRTLNSSSQIIVATHSPEIAGGWNDFIIDMEDIIRG